MSVSAVSGGVTGAVVPVPTQQPNETDNHGAKEFNQLIGNPKIRATIQISGDASVTIPDNIPTTEDGAEEYAQETNAGQEAISTLGDALTSASNTKPGGSDDKNKGENSAQH